MHPNVLGLLRQLRFSAVWTGFVTQGSPKVASGSWVSEETHPRCRSSHALLARPSEGSRQAMFGGGCAGSRGTGWPPGLVTSPRPLGGREASQTRAGRWSLAPDRPGAQPSSSSGRVGPARGSELAQMPQGTGAGVLTEGTGCTHIVGHPSGLPGRRAELSHRDENLARCFSGPRARGVGGGWEQVEVPEHCGCTSGLPWR